MHGSDDRESWVGTGRGRDLSVPSWYGSDVSEEERTPTESEISYVKSKINCNNYVKWVSISILTIVALYLFYIPDGGTEGSWVVFLSGVSISIAIYFIGEKYIPKKVNKSKKLRSVSGKPRFPAGAFSFYSGYVASLIVDGIRFRVPHHWAFNILPYDLGKREVEVEIYETNGESYALSIDGFSIEKEAGNGLFDVLMDLRRLYVIFAGLILSFFSAPVLADTGALVLIGIQDPVDYSPPETWGAVIFQTPTLIFICVALVLGGPAIWLYVKHRRALHNIRTMYREEGVIE